MERHAAVAKTCSCVAVATAMLEGWPARRAAGSRARRGQTTLGLSETKLNSPFGSVTGPRFRLHLPGRPLRTRERVRQGAGP